MNDSSSNTPQKPETNDEAQPDPDQGLDSSSGAASFWDESQIQQVIRHAGRSGCSPEEFFNKKWKDRIIHKKKEAADDSEG